MEIEGLQCICSTNGQNKRIAYILYPMDVLSDWIEDASERYQTNIVVITGMDWQNVFSPWPAKGVPKGSPDFKGESPEFLKLLQQKVLPQIDSTPSWNEPGESISRSIHVRVIHIMAMDVMRYF